MTDPNTPLPHEEIAYLIRSEREADGPFRSDWSVRSLEVAMRNAAPRLLAEVLRLREENERLKLALQATKPLKFLDPDNRTGYDY